MLFFATINVTMYVIKFLISNFFSKLNAIVNQN